MSLTTTKTLTFLNRSMRLKTFVENDIIEKLSSQLR